MRTFLLLMFTMTLTSVTCVAQSSLESPASLESLAEVQPESRGPVNLEPLSLPSTGGQTIELAADVDFQVFCFLGTECPLARLYGPRLQQLSDRFVDDGVRFIGINSNVQDSMEELRTYVGDHELSFPNCKDFDRTAAQLLGVTRTPEVVVVDRAGAIRYRGRIDDQYQPGIARATAKEHHLRVAIESLISGVPVDTPVTAPVGCLIPMPAVITGEDTDVESNVTYCDQIARVLQRNCIECHREGEIGPFSLEDYDEVVGWAAMMVEVVDEARMPPWHANPDHGDFANARHMSDDDKQSLRDWLDAGTPYGDASRKPKPQQFVQGWRLPKDPDAVFEMSEEPFVVPADGIVEYQYFVVDPEFTEDKWVAAAEILPGNAAVVHHAIAFVRPPDGSEIRDLGMLSAYVPGQTLSPLPTGYARRVAAGSRIVFQMHYTPNGRKQSDTTRIGIVFADDESVTHEVLSTGGIEQEFEIPPHESGHVVEGKIRGYPLDGELLSVTPHMHLRGKAFQLIVDSADGSKILLDVPHYDFNWQHNYELAQPLALADVKALRFTATFDNSSNNPTNPDPAEYVTWGDQTWQEMAVTFAAVAKPRFAQKKATKPTEQQRAAAEELRQQRIERRNEVTARAEAFAGDYIERFDANDDGTLASRELPHSVRMFFRDLDNNSDSVITKLEIQEMAFRRFWHN